MKTMKYLGCLLALVFAGASAFAGTWFSNVVGESLGTGWSNTTGWTWNGDDGSYNNWTAPLTYTRSDDAQPLASKDSTITTSVKFTAMDAEDLAEQTIGTDVKGGLTVVEIAGDTPTLSYYGIVNDAGTKKWMPLTGVTPTLDEFVTVTVELKNNLNSTYTITYKVDGDALTVASGSSFTMATATEATISTVEYLGQFSLASLSGATWFNPVAVVTTGLPTGVDSVKTLVGGAEASGPFARGTTVSFAFTPGEGYAITPVAGSIELDGESASVTPTWASYVTAAAIPVGEGMPSKITVDAEAVASRVDGGAKGTTETYLYTQQANGQLGWVNVTLGIADAETAKIEAQPVEQLDSDAVVLDFNLDENEKAFYKVNNVSNDAPVIALGETKAANNGIVKVDVVVKDEGAVDHVIATKDVGVLEAGKDTTGATDGTKTFDIVGVPWGSMDPTAETVSLDELLNKTLLTLGDKVYIKNGADYDIYTLKADGEVNRSWEKEAAAKGRSLAAASTAPALNKGDALWIEHDVASRIVFSGAAIEQPVSKTASMPAKEGDEAWSLIANTSLKPLALSSITPSGANDKIIVETIGAPIQYEYQNGAWGYWEKQKQDNGRNKLVWVVGTSIPSGQGFWYVNTGSTDVTISFPSNVDQAAD